MFASGLNKIYEKISQISDAQQQLQAFNHLENQLLKNPYLKHQFEVMNKIKRNRGVITTQENFNAFVKALHSKRVKFMNEHKSHSHFTFWKHTKELLEFYNINPKDIVVNELDIAIDIYAASKRLNEGIIKNLVVKAGAEFTNGKIAEKGIIAENTVAQNVDNPAKNVDNYKKTLSEAKNMAKYSFFRLRNTKNDIDLDNQFSIIHFLSEGMKGTCKKMIQTSLAVLKEGRKKDVGATIKKLYKLRVITEKIIRGEHEEVNGKTYFATPKDLKKFNFINHLEIVSPFDYTRPEKILIIMEIPIYPLGITRNSVVTSVGRVEQKMKTFKSVFVNKLIYQADRTRYFNPNGTIWTADASRLQIKPGEDVKIKIGCYIATNPEGDGINKFEDFVTQGLQMVSAFDKMLPELLGELQGNLSKEERDEQLNKASGKSKSEKTAIAKATNAIDQKLLNKLLYKDAETSEEESEDWMDGILFRKEFPNTSKFTSKYHPITGEKFSDD